MSLRSPGLAVATALSRLPRFAGHNRPLRRPPPCLLRYPPYRSHWLPSTTLYKQQQQYLQEEGGMLAFFRFSSIILNTASAGSMSAVHKPRRNFCEYSRHDEQYYRPKYCHGWQYSSTHNQKIPRAWAVSVGSVSNPEIM